MAARIDRLQDTPFLLWLASCPFGCGNLFPRLPQRRSDTSEGFRQVFVSQIGKAAGSRVQLMDDRRPTQGRWLSVEVTGTAGRERTNNHLS